MTGRVGHRALAVGTAVLALGIIGSAVLWVTHVRFKDEGSATDCGTPLAAAWHGQLAPKPISQLPPGAVPDPRYPGALLSVPLGAHLFNRVCQREARTRIAISAASIVI